VALTELVDTGLMSVRSVLAALSWNPARIAGLETVHGRPVASGELANLVVFDPSVRWTVDRRDVASKSGNTPFHGRELSGRVRHTILNGVAVVVDGTATK